MTNSSTTGPCHFHFLQPMKVKYKSPIETKKMKVTKMGRLSIEAFMTCTDIDIKFSPVNHQKSPHSTGDNSHDCPLWVAE